MSGRRDRDISNQERAAVVAIEASEALRRRIARELHDDLGQELTALVLGLKSVEDVLDEGSAVHREVQRLRTIAGKMGRDVHHIALELRPGGLDDQGIQTALANYIEEWSQRNHIAADFQHVGSAIRRLPSHIETTIYRIVQEALTNVSKHANASAVSVVLQRHADSVVTIVEDNGCGFDETTAPAAGLGLLGMKERVALLRGTCQVESRPGSTTIFARIPLAVDDEDHA